MAVTRNLFRNENILFLAKVIKFSNRENTYNCIARANFNLNLDFPKINLKLCSYVLGTKKKLKVEPIFGLGLRSEKIEFLNVHPGLPNFIKNE